MILINTSGPHPNVAAQNESKQIDYKTDIKGIRTLEIYLAKFFIQI